MNRENNSADLFLGTSGYSYNDWKHVFYPDNLPKNQWLRYYSKFFNAVELNFSFYRIPSSSIFKSMSEQTPENFQFIVKMHQSITHQFKKDENILSAFHEAIEPFKNESKFGGFLFQFPYAFKYSRQSADLIKWICGYFRQEKCFFEFRHVSWLKEDLFEYLNREKQGFVIVDEPKLNGLLPPVIKLTSGEGYIRFHGRNKTNWWNGTNEERYNYLYSSDQLEKWYHEITKILKISYKMFIFFNNHPQGKAVKNAQMLKQMIIGESNEASHTEL